MKRAAAYIDGFNLFYGLKDLRKEDGRENRWLDLVALAQALAPWANLVRVRYFTARVDDRGESGRSQRQDVYLRALEARGGVHIHYGKFVTRSKWMPLVQPIAGQGYAEVWRTEEKGSDVNLATYLLLDAIRDVYDVALVISNDADLAEPVRVLRDELRKEVIVVSPQGPNQNELEAAATQARRIWPDTAVRCQLPNPVTGADGRAIYRPPQWV